MAISSCNSFVDTEGAPITLTEQETLNFLISNSDLIAIVYQYGGTEKPKPSLFSKLPEKVDAKILSVIKGEEDRESIKISYTPKHLRPNVVKSFMILRNGKHLAFLSKDGENYQPTTAHSLLNISNNKVYPIWRPDQYKESEDAPHGYKVSHGIKLEEVLGEIRMEIQKS